MMSAHEPESRSCARCGATKPISAFKKYVYAPTGQVGYAKTCTGCYVQDTLARRRAAAGRRYKELLPGLLALVAQHGPVRVKKLMQLVPDGNSQLAGQVLHRAEREGLIIGVMGSSCCKRWSLATGAKIATPEINLSEVIERRKMTDEMDRWYDSLIPAIQDRTAQVNTMRGRV